MELTVNQTLQKAIAAHQNNKLEEAEILYRKVLEIQSTNLDANNNLGILLQKQNKYDDAIINYKKVIELKPDYAEAHNNLGNVLQTLSRFKEAEKSCNKAIELKPDYVAAHNNIGNALFKLNKFDEAEASYKKAVKLKPDYAPVYNNLGNLVKSRGRLDEAELYYKRAIELKPNFLEAFNNLGVTLDELGRLEDAIINYRKATEFDPDFIAITNFINIGDWESSKEFLQKFCSKEILRIKIITHVFVRAWCVFCRKLLDQDDLKGFVKIFTKLFIMNERDSDLNNLTKYFFENFDIDKILESSELKDKILIKVSFCKYKFMIEDFITAEKIAASNIFDAITLVKNSQTEDIGWLIVQRSLKLCKNKDFARKTLNDFMNKIKLIN